MSATAIESIRRRAHPGLTSAVRSSPVVDTLTREHDVAERRRSSRGGLGALVAVTISATVIVPMALARPLDGDEGFYSLAAKLVGDGKEPYSDFWFQHAPLLPYVYGAWGRIFGDGWYSYRLLCPRCSPSLFRFFCTCTSAVGCGTNIVATRSRSSRSGCSRSPGLCSSGTRRSSPSPSQRCSYSPHTFGRSVGDRTRDIGARGALCRALNRHAASVRRGRSGVRHLHGTQ